MVVGIDIGMFSPIITTKFPLITKTIMLDKSLIEVCAAVFGLVYVPCNIKLIDSRKYGFAVNSGKPYIMFPGWNSLLSPYSHFVSE